MIRLPSGLQILLSFKHPAAYHCEDSMLYCCCDRRGKPCSSLPKNVGYYNNTTDLTIGFVWRLGADTFKNLFMEVGFLKVTNFLFSAKEKGVEFF